jgi:hypothetical protein
VRSFLAEYEEGCDVPRGSVQVVTDAADCAAGNPKTREMREAKVAIVDAWYT